MRHISAICLLATMFGCIPGGGGKDSGSGDSGDPGDTSDSGGTDTSPVDRGAGDVNGTVYVQLYSTDADGDTVEVSWEEYGGDFPFGAIYVAAYTRDETTDETTYHAEQVIGAPSTAGDGYSLSVDMDDAEQVYLYAVLDYYGDGVIGTSEPIGIYAEMVPVTEGTAVDGVDIYIHAPCPCGWDSDGSGCGGGLDYVTISGDLTITEPYTGGGAKVMLYDSASQGPYYVTSVQPTETEDGAEGTYSLPVGVDSGTARLIAAWDDDQNGLIDPTDQWGAYVVEGENGNPITVGSTDLTGYDVQIPFGIPPALTPFVRIEGTIGYDADFSTLPAGAVVYVTALRTRPPEDFSVADLERAFDSASFTGAELTGTALDYVLVAPTSQVAYLWAFADLDNDGVLNEAGEPVASYGRTGRLETGTTNQSHVDMLLQNVVE